MTTKTTERDLIEEVEELLAKHPRGGVTFPQPSRSRTRDVLNDYGCGCQVRRDGAGAHLIHACATHNSAPELLRRLVEEVKGDRELLRECLSYVLSSAEASRMIDGFEPQEHKEDRLAARLVDAIGDTALRKLLFKKPKGPF